MQKSLTVEDTILAKRAFQSFARNHGITVKHYHADNGRFADKQFLAAVDEDNQTISFCAAYAHFQNGKAEKRIRDLQDRTRRVLLHSVARWPTVSSTHLWPFALHHVNETENNIPKYVHCSSPLELFGGSQVKPRLSSYHTFGCPVYTLNTKLQSGKSIPKWDPRCNLGLYLGNSPRHARSVSLVLNIQTGRVSPQFHVQHDEFFETIPLNDRTPSKWKRVAGFYSYKDKQIRRKPTEDIFRREAGYQVANSNQDLPIVPNIDLDHEEIIPPPDGEQNDTSSQDEQNNGISGTESTDDIPSLIPRRSRRNRVPTDEFLQSVAQQDLTFDHRVHQPALYQLPSDAPPQTIAFSTYYDTHNEDDYLFQDAIRLCTLCLSLCDFTNAVELLAG